MASSFLWYVFFFGLILLFAGETIANAMRWPPAQRLAGWVKTNQGTAMIMVFAANYLSTQLLSTGAFEVYYDDRLVFSRLESGALPDPDRLLELARSAPDSATDDYAALPPNSY